MPGIKVTFGAADGKGTLCEAVAAIGGVLATCSIRSTLVKD